jgi:hypothetical protein
VKEIKKLTHSNSVTCPKPILERVTGNGNI